AGLHAGARASRNSLAFSHHRPRPQRRLCLDHLRGRPSDESPGAGASALNDTTRLKVPNFCEGTLRLSIGAPREVLRTVTPCDCHWRPLETSPASPARGRHRPARAAATGKPARVEATIPTHGTEGPG